MTYATQDDMTERFGSVEMLQLTDTELPAQGVIVAAVLNMALADADGIINRYLGARYTVPLAASYPADVVRVACDIARYMLHDLASPETVRKHYEDATTWLRDVSAGKLPLIGSDGAIVAAKGGAVSSSARAPYAADATFGDAFAAAWAP